MKRKIIIIILCMLLFFVPVSYAQTTDFGSFETTLDTKPKWDISFINPTSNNEVTRQNHTVIDGEWALEASAEYNSGSSHSIAESNGTAVLGNSDNFTITYYWYPDFVSNNQQQQLRINDTSNGNQFGFRTNHAGDIGSDLFGSEVSNQVIVKEVCTLGDFDNACAEHQRWHYVKIWSPKNSDTINVTMRLDGPSGGVIFEAYADYTGNISEIDSTVQFRVIDHTGGTETYYFDDLDGVNPGDGITFNEKIELEAKNYMEHDSSQNYKVKYTKTDKDTGNVIEEKYVTSNSTVISNNTNVITVDNSTFTLQSTNNTTINKKVKVNATYSGEIDTLEDEINITVANATLKNIGILPNTKWVSSFSGVNDSGLQYGLGAQIQWIFFIILMMVTTTHIAQSKWIGLGTGEILLILFWLTEFIGLGMFLGSMIFGIFMILTQMGRNDQNVTIQQPPNNDF